MKDNTKHFTAKGTLYFLLQKYALITDDQRLLCWPHRKLQWQNTRLDAGSCTILAEQPTKEETAEFRIFIQVTCYFSCSLP